MQRVDERQEPRALELDVRAGHVRRPRPRVGVVVDDPVEEVDREERAEQHDLRPDEQEDPDDDRVDPRAVVDRRRMLVRVSARVRRDRCGSACALMSAPSETTWSTGRPVSLRSRPTRSRRSQPERALGKVETMISSTRSSCVASIVAVNGSGWTTWPCASIPSERSSESARRRRLVGLGARYVARLRRDDQEARRALRGPRANAVEQLLRDDGLVRDDEDVAARSVGVVGRDHVAHRDVAGGLRDVADDVAAHPAGALLGMGRDDDLGRRRLELDERILRRLHRARLDHEALGRDRRTRAAAPSVLSSRRPAEARRVSW